MKESMRRFEREVRTLREQGLYKVERIVTTPQAATVATAEDGTVFNFCANNYLGLASHPDIVAAAGAGLLDYGFGMASVRFICGTQDLHKRLERTIAAFLGTEDAVLYSSCFDANTGLFETLLGPEDAVISDALNHASLIDGIRLCKAARFRYAHLDLADLERQLRKARPHRTRLIATDGVFSMDGDIAPLVEIVALAERYDALLLVDDSHGTGVIGATGRGSAEHHGVLERVDLFTSTLGKALGGGSGGFTAGSRAVCELLRQRSRTYLFSNSLAPPLVAGALKAFEILQSSTDLRDRLLENTRYFRQRMTDAGFALRPGIHPIVPVMLYDARLAQEMAARLLRDGIFVVGFAYPVVPQGEARIRAQISAAHSREQIERAVDAFVKVGRELGVV